MRSTRFLIVLLAVAAVAWPLATPAPAQDKAVFIPLLVYRTGPYAPNGIPWANGFNDYYIDRSSAPRLTFPHQTVGHTGRPHGQAQGEG